MSSERVACTACGQWMFHLAKVCPHCGAGPGAAAPAKTEPSKEPKKPGLSLTAEEARAMLSLTTTGAEKPETLQSVTDRLISPRGGALELVTSVLAAPLTFTTVLTLGWYLVRMKPAQRTAALTGAGALAVPASTALFAVTLFEFEAPAWAYGVLGVSFLAWAVRGVRRLATSVDPLK